MGVEDTQTAQGVQPLERWLRVYMLGSQQQSACRRARPARTRQERQMGLKESEAERASKRETVIEAGTVTEKENPLL